MKRIIWALAVVLALQDPANAADRLETGSGDFVHVDDASGKKREIPVHYHLPRNYTPDRPILFVMHGNSRAALRYWRDWEEHAEKYNALVLVPEFDKWDFPGSASYHNGGMYDAVSGEENPRHAWTYTIIGRIFDQARALTGSTRTTFLMYGHSAGGQFVHRYLTYTGGERVSRAVAANAGWYTLPMTDVEYPYGLKDSPATRENLAPLFAKNLIILLGEDDTEQTRSLRQTPEAMEQGPHRLARGQYYFDSGQKQAARLGVPFRWRIATVPDAGHSNRQMAPAAAKLLFEN